MDDSKNLPISYPPRLSEEAVLRRSLQSDHPVDRLVGHRVCLMRKAIGLSQMELGAAIGVSFQQVQKYEKGTNRISASRLFAIATVLGVKVGDLFAEAASVADEANGGSGHRKRAELTPLDIKIATGLALVRDASVKQQLYDLIAALAKED